MACSAQAILMHGNKNSVDGIGLNASFNMPRGILHKNGFLYVNDLSSVRRINLDNMSVTTIAGQVSNKGSLDGIGIEAKFSDLEGITNIGDYIYVSEWGNHQIRRIYSVFD